MNTKFSASLKIDGVKVIVKKIENAETAAKAEAKEK